MDYDAVLRKTTDTSRLIFDYRFQVRVPHQETRSMEELRIKGTRLSDLDEINKSVSKEMRICYLSISQMVDYYKESVPIAFLRQTDTEVVYKFIAAHIEAWKDNMLKSINIGSAPLDDLIQLDDFASSVYKYARHHMRDKGFLELMSVRLGGQLVHQNSLFRNYDPVADKITEPEAAKKKVLPTHESQADFFKNKQIAQAAFGARRGQRQH